MRREASLSSPSAKPSEAVPICRLVCQETGEVVGIEYRWNTGEISVLWRGETSKAFVKRPIRTNTERAKS